MKLSVQHTLHFLALALIAFLQSPTVAREEATLKPGLQKTKPQEGFSVATDRGHMTSYTVQIPGTNVTFEMVPIPGGQFLFGSPDSEAHRNHDEGPQVQLQVAPFWMGRCEVTWAEYHAYMATYQAFKRLGDLRLDPKSIDSLKAVKNYFDHESLEVDAVTSPTPLYDTATAYGPGEEPNQPAISMTQYAAKQYTKWLSGITGNAYRLPTEAEWEYAARAGNSTAYSFGHDPNSLADYAWYDENSDYQTQPVGTKKPNAWGLHDMHGNVAEWVLDEYAADHYSKLTGENLNATTAIRWPTKLYPRVFRGGCWFDEAPLCRSAARQQSDDPEWFLSDPNLPKSPWWYTEDPTSGIGFRIIRPLIPLDNTLRKKVWDADIEDLQFDVAERLQEGRGTQSSADPRLPAAIQELKSTGILD